MSLRAPDPKKRRLWDDLAEGTGTVFNSAPQRDAKDDRPVRDALTRKMPLAAAGPKTIADGMTLCIKVKYGGANPNIVTITFEKKADEAVELKLHRNQTPYCGRLRRYFLHSSQFLCTEEQKFNDTPQSVLNVNYTQSHIAKVLVRGMTEATAKIIKQLFDSYQQHAGYADAALAAQRQPTGAFIQSLYAAHQTCGTEVMRIVFQEDFKPHAILIAQFAFLEQVYFLMEAMTWYFQFATSTHSNGLLSMWPHLHVTAESKDDSLNVHIVVDNSGPDQAPSSLYFPKASDVRLTVTKTRGGDPECEFKTTVAPSTLNAATPEQVFGRIVAAVPTCASPFKVERGRIMSAVEVTEFPHPTMLPSFVTSVAVMPINYRQAVVQFNGEYVTMLNLDTMELVHIGNEPMLAHTVPIRAPDELGGVSTSTIATFSFSNTLEATDAVFKLECTPERKLYVHGGLAKRDVDAFLTRLPAAVTELQKDRIIDNLGCINAIGVSSGGDITAVAVAGGAVVFYNSSETFNNQRSKRLRAVDDRAEFQHKRCNIRSLSVANLTSSVVCVVLYADSALAAMTLEFDESWFVSKFTSDDLQLESKDTVTFVRGSANSNQNVLVAAGRVAYVLEPRSKPAVRVRSTLNGHNAHITCGDFTSYGCPITADVSGVVIVWHHTTGHFIGMLQPALQIHSLHVVTSPNLPDRVLISSNDGNVSMVDVRKSFRDTYLPIPSRLTSIECDEHGACKPPVLVSHYENPHSGNKLALLYLGKVPVQSQDADDEYQTTNLYRRNYACVDYTDPRSLSTCMFQVEVPDDTDMLDHNVPMHSRLCSMYSQSGVNYASVPRDTNSVYLVPLVDADVYTSYDVIQPKENPFSKEYGDIYKTCVVGQHMVIAVNNLRETEDNGSGRCMVFVVGLSNTEEPSVLVWDGTIHAMSVGEFTGFGDTFVRVAIAYSGNLDEPGTRRIAVINYQDNKTDTLKEMEVHEDPRYPQSPVTHVELLDAEHVAVVTRSSVTVMSITRSLATTELTDIDDIEDTLATRIDINVESADARVFDAYEVSYIDPYLMVQSKSGLTQYFKFETDTLVLVEVKTVHSVCKQLSGKACLEVLNNFLVVRNPTQKEPHSITRLYHLVKNAVPMEIAASILL